MISSFVIAWVSFIIALIGVGLVAGFSPTLYMTQIAVLTRAKRPVYQCIILLAGVLSSLLLLGGIFFIMRPEAFVITGITNTITEGLFDGTAGALCIVVGIVLVVRTRLKTRRGVIPKERSQSTKGAVALYSLGFVRGITRVSGVAALFLGVRMIINTDDILLYQLVSFAVLLFGAMIPFFFLVWAKLYMPRTFSHVQKASDKVFSVDYRRYTGHILIVIGGLLVLLPVIFTL